MRHADVDGWTQPKRPARESSYPMLCYVILSYGRELQDLCVSGESYRRAGGQEGGPGQVQVGRQHGREVA